MIKNFIFASVFIITLSINTHAQVKTQSGHSISFGVVGLEYAYEHALAKKFTLNCAGDVGGLLGWGPYFNVVGLFDKTYSLSPYISLDLRKYTNLNKRVERGKNIFGNAGYFVGLQCDYVFKPITKHKIYKKDSGIAIIPHCGLRHLWGQHFLSEFTMGITFAKNEYRSSKTGASYALKFGYRF